MQKFKVLVTIKSYCQDVTYQTEATYNESKNYIYYFEQDDDKTIAIYDYNTNILKRDNLKISQKLEFIKDKITINKMEIKDLDKSLELEIFTSDIISNSPAITINYSLNAEKYLYKIEVLEELK